MDYFFGDGITDPTQWTSAPDCAVSDPATLDAVRIDFRGSGALSDVLWDSDHDGLADQAILDYGTAQEQRYTDDGSGTWAIALPHEGVTPSAAVPGASPGKPTSGLRAAGNAVEAPPIESSPTPAVPAPEVLAVLGSISPAVAPTPAAVPDPASAPMSAAAQPVNPALVPQASPPDPLMTTKLPSFDAQDLGDAAKSPEIQRPELRHQAAIQGGVDRAPGALIAPPDAAATEAAPPEPIPEPVPDSGETPPANAAPASDVLPPAAERENAKATAERTKNMLPQDSPLLEDGVRPIRPLGE